MELTTKRWQIISHIIMCILQQRSPCRIHSCRDFSVKKRQRTQSVTRSQDQYDSRKYHQLKIKRPQVILYTGIVLSVIESLRKPWSCLIISFFTYNNFDWRRYQAALLPFLFRSKYQRSLEKDIRAGTKNLHSTDGSFHHFLQLFC